MGGEVISNNSKLPIIEPEDVRSGAVFQVLETRPDNVRIHGVLDHELDYLTSIGRPIILGLSTMFMGGFLGLIPSVLDAIDHIGARFTGRDYILSLFAIGCFVASGCFGWFAAKSEIDSLRIKAEIRGRKATPMKSRRGGFG